MHYYIGTSGWTYTHWKYCFYEGVKRADWLKHYAERFNTLELNSSFYRLPKKEYVEKWVHGTPKDFVFAIKAWRTITHYRKLEKCNTLLARFMKHIALMGKKCGPILFQLPVTVECDLSLLQRFFATLPSGYRYSFELRHPSWWCEEVYALLAEHNVAFCIFELGQLHSPRKVTADFLYLRLHGRSTAYYGNYDDDALEEWAEWLVMQQKEMYVYFDNTAEECAAIQNAIDLKRLVRKHFIFANRSENVV